MRAAAAALLAATVVATVAACGGSSLATTPSASATPGPIHLGAIFNLTGGQAMLDGPSLDGARLAVDRINAAGGLLGRRVDLLELDGQSDPAVVNAAARELATSGVSAIIGLSDTNQVLAAAPVAARAHIPFVTSGATSPQLVTKVPGWLFLTSFGDNVQAAAGAQYARNALAARTVAILYDQTLAYTRLLSRYFSRSFRAQHGTVVSDQGFDPAKDDPASLLEALGAKPVYGGEGDDDVVGSAGGVRPDLLYVAAGPQEAPTIVRRLRAAGYRQPIMGGDSYATSDLYSAAEDTGGGVYFTTQAALGLAHQTAAMRRFTKLYQAAYGRAPENAFAGLGYDTVNLVAHAIVSAKSSDPWAIRNALAQTRGFHGVTGLLSLAGADGSHRQVVVVAVGSRPRMAAVITPRLVPRP